MAEMKIFLATLMVCLLLLFWLPITSGSPQEIKLQKAGRVEMLNLQEGDPRPFFSVRLNIVNQDGSPAEIKLAGKNHDLKDLIEIDVGDGSPFHPFYVAGLDSTGPNTHTGRDIMMLFDTSGSMKDPLPGTSRSRYDAAKDAARVLLNNFRDQVDNISIVKFDSHNVASTIKGAEFVNTKAGAEAQINSLPSPDGNTALYSATATALQVMEKRRQSTPGGQGQFLLIVLTDGTNDVENEGDDPQLLKGEDGLKAVVAKADAVDIPVYTIGLGKSGKDFNASVLQRMAHPQDNFFQASDASQLRDKFQMVEQLYTGAFVMTFSTKRYTDWKSLKNITFRVRLNRSGGNPLESGEIVWSCPTLSGCSPVGTLSAEERAALLQDSGEMIPPPSNPWFHVLYLLGILALLSGGMAFLWFIPPRLLWPRHPLSHLSSSVASVSRPRIPRMPKETPPPPSRSRVPETGESKNARPETRKRLDETRVISKDRNKR
jgi:von Willebrand factor type A domain